ncbi:MAG: sugar ABC transporter permease [Lachnospiraceae bacterium]|nr:sugar ABC transporter permease [Lachnospiraceae bacterium]
MSAKSIITKYAMTIATVLVIIVFTITTGGKLLFPQNVNNVIAQNAYVFVIAMGMLLCILTGGNIDLSVGSVVGLVGAVGAVLMVNHKVPIPLTMIVCIIVGIAIGAWQGYWIAYQRIPPFITTLAGMYMWRGLCNAILQGLTISPMPEKFNAIFNSYVPDLFGKSEEFNVTCFAVGIIICIVYAGMQFSGRAKRIKKGYDAGSLPAMLGKTIVICAVVIFFMYKLSKYQGIPVILIWVTVIVLIYTYITSKTTTGRYFYAVGGNEAATEMSGIDTNKVYFIAYTNVAFLSSIAGLIIMARLNSANPTAGTNYEMDAIASCFIGGASAYGGIGTTTGVVIGATLMGVLNLGMSIMGVDMNWQRVVKGGVLLIAVIFDVVSKRKSS